VLQYMIVLPFGVMLFLLLLIKTNEQPALPV
jgi:hypothetical protein